MASVFFSYSHKDEALRDQLESHLALLKNQGLIDAWYDRRIVAGDEVDDAIFSKLESADIVLLLVSSDFISSPYCYSREMMRAMERHEASEARVIPVILRHCVWQGAPFGKLMEDHVPELASPDELRQMVLRAEVDMRAVKANVREYLGAVGRASTGDFLKAYPASQGLGTVLGYLQLAIKHGQMEPDRERLDWIGMDGVPRAAWAARYVMTVGCIDAIR